MRATTTATATVIAAVITSPFCSQKLSSIPGTVLIKNQWMPRTRAVFLDALGTLVELEPPWVHLREALGGEVGVETLMGAIDFGAFPDAVPALTGLRERGLRLVCVSNWDCALPEVLERCGLAHLVDGTVTSALAGARKPDPAIFAPALELARCGPDEALHVGDTPEEDLDAARAAGIRALLLDREGEGDIASLLEIDDHLDA